MESPAGNAKDILIVSCESGGAQILASLVKSEPDRGYLFCLEGPAVKVFGDTNMSIKTVSLDFICGNKKGIDLVLTGTSWTPELERHIIALSKRNGIKTASVLDHWTNYRERFLPQALWKKNPDNWTDYLPDEVWVCDRYAYDIALGSGFPAKKVRMTSNYYLNEIARMFATEDRGKAAEGMGKDLKILYVSEPVADDLNLTFGDPNYWGYTEFDLARSIVDFISCLADAHVKIRFRLHPNEATDKYDKYISWIPQIEKSPCRSLVDDLIWADAVVGVESMAMAIALAAGKPVFSIFPEGARKRCCLPHKEIIHIRSFREIITLLDGKKPKKEGESI